MNDGNSSAARPAADARTFFFVHVMKTGGTTFAQHLHANFLREQRYPLADQGVKRQQEYYLIDEVRALTPEQRATIRLYAGHFPYVVSDLVAADVTLTILRDPVERTVSFLRHCKRYHERMRDMELEEIYVDGWMHPLCIRNYQTKMFAMTLDDKLESHLDVIEIDAARFDIALATLERVDVLGLNDRYEEFVAEVRNRFGWKIGPAPDLRVSTEDWDVSSSFHARIAEENAADVAFYAAARKLHEKRHRRA